MDMDLDSTFTKCKCIVVNQNGKFIVTGSCQGGGLYSLNGDQPIVEQIYFAKATADLETWLRCLGQVSYASILHMAKWGMALGMSTDLPSIPATREHCILGKQSKAPVPKFGKGSGREGCLIKSFPISLGLRMSPPVASAML
jgi:hypothetical protein